MIISQNKKGRKGKIRNIAREVMKQFYEITSDRLGKIGVSMLSVFIMLAIIGPALVPHDPFQALYRSDGSLARLDPPSGKYWLGTTNLGEDVLSQTLLGTRLALIVGLISAACISFIGTNVGLIAGYFGGKLDDLLMRTTDMAYGIPFIPFGIILVALLGSSKWNIIIAISLLLWRTNARVIRSQVLSLKERPFIWCAMAGGAGHLRILYRHIAPNILPLSFLYVALGCGSAVTAEASLSFIGLGDPDAISWGKMLYFAFYAGAMRTAWWWVIPPGFCIGLLVVSCYLVARAYEKVVNPKLRES